MQRACGTGLLMVVVLGGCAEEGPVEPAQPPEPEPVPTSITVAPASVTLWWPGATTQLVARVLDQNGEVMAGATMSWSSDDGSVAGVSASGLVTAVAQGSAEVTAEVAGFSLSASAAVAVDSISDRDALVAFYHATGGPNWYFAGYNWLTEKPLSSWGHVTTDDQGRVTGLEFRATRMVGSLPPELGALANLEVLKIVGNRGLGRGSIPPELGSLKNLRVLNLRSNALTGPIPPTLSNLPELVELDLEWNRLTGQIPVGLGDLANLKVLNLSHNLLTGPIPPQLGNLGGLEVLDLQSNDLTGPIPPELGNLGSLEVLDLGLYGGLPGPIPPELGNLGDLVSLSLRGGSINGPDSAAARAIAQTRVSVPRREIHGHDPGRVRQHDRASQTARARRLRHDPRRTREAAESPGFAPLLLRTHGVDSPRTRRSGESEKSVPAREQADGSDPT